MEAKVYSQTGGETGTVELPEAVFGLKWNADLVHQVVTSQMANQRLKVAHVKGRGEVRGGGKKPWRQKGTGRARHGSIRSPIWKGGGVTHGPTKEENFKKKINRKMAQKALYTVLSAKARDGEIIVMEDLKLSEPKTKLAAKVFENLSRAKEFKNLKKGNGVLVALPARQADLPEKESLTRRAIRNLPYAGVEEARSLNAHEVLQYKYILFPKDVIGIFNKKV